jgi:TRAP-type C4-dicarboxylate transport system substrate-binding protein
VLFEFGIGRVAIHHYLLRVSAAPLALVMGRKQFNRLPEEIKVIIRKHSGEWLAAHFVEGLDALEKRDLAKIKSDPRRTLVSPSSADLATARHAFRSVIEERTKAGTHMRKLVNMVEAELVNLRSE